MINLTREEAQQVLDALVCAAPHGWSPNLVNQHNKALKTLRAKLSEPEPEPVGWINAPERIYLQVCDDENCDLSFEAHDDVSWCQDKINHCDILYVRADIAPPQPEPKPVGNTLTFMTRAIFNVIAKHQEINGGYFIADGDIDDFIERLAKVINSTFEPLAKLKEKNND